MHFVSSLEAIINAQQERCISTCHFHGFILFSLRNVPIALYIKQPLAKDYTEVKVIYILLACAIRHHPFQNEFGRNLGSPSNNIKVICARI